VIPRTILIALLAWALHAQAQEPPAWFSESLLDFREDIVDAARDGKRLMVYFGQDGCPYCTRLMEVHFRQQAIVDKARKNFIALAINIWGDRDVAWLDGRKMSEKQFAAMMKVQFTPTLVFLDERGAVVLRINGYYAPERLEAALDFVAGRMERKMAFLDYAAASEKTPAASSLADEPFFMAKPQDLRRQLGAKPLAVLFETVSCAGCDELHREGFKRPEVLAEIGKFDMVRFVPTDLSAIFTPGAKRQKQKVAEWARTLNLGYVPTIIFFDSRGREVFRVEAYVRPFHLAGAFEYVSSGAYTTEPSFQRFLQAKAERLKKGGATVDLWN
jgi:thioredoxin-related protein